MNNLTIKQLVLTLLALMIMPVVAHASCSIPPGEAGDIGFNSDSRVLQWCDGTDWYAAGQINPAGPNDGCLGPEGIAGDVIYNDAQNLMQYCDGDHWQGIGGGVDMVPAGFTFTDLINQAQSSLVTSNIVNITGLGVPADVTVTGDGSPEFRINGGSWVSGGTISDGQTLQLRMTTPATTGATNTAGVFVGTMGALWSTSTAGADTTPNAFSFSDQTGVATSFLASSNTVTITGINSSTPVSVSGSGSPQISINGGAWVTSGNINNGQTLQVRLTSSPNGNTTFNATVTVGGVTDIWSVKTLGGGSPSETLVFVTSATYSPNFGGLAGTHAACAARAAAVGLAGTYKAWISDTASDAPANTFIQSSVPYKMINGTKVADDWADLTDGTLDAAISIDETGASASGTQNVFTHVSTAGAQEGNDCANWTSTSSGNNVQIGSSNATGSAWTNATSVLCNTGNRRLYCFEQANGPPTTVAFTAGFDYGSLSNNTTTTIGSNVSFGAAAADRVMILALYFNDQDSTTINSVTIGGVTATSRYQSTNGTIRMAFFSAAVPTGTSGDVRVNVTNSGTLAYTYGALWRATGLQSQTPTATANSSADPGTGTLSVPVDGFALGFTGSGAPGGSPTCTWTGMTESFDVTSGSGNTGTSGATFTGSGSISITSDWTATTSGGRKSIYAAWR